MASQKWLVAWDFPKRPVSTFYDIYADEFGPEVKRVQRSVVICKDDFTASRLVALLEFYGANVLYFGVDPDAKLDVATLREAGEFVERIHAQRLHQRGRPAGNRGVFSERSRGVKRDKPGRKRR